MITHLCTCINYNITSILIKKQIKFFYKIFVWKYAIENFKVSQHNVSYSLIIILHSYFIFLTTKYEKINTMILNIGWNYLKTGLWILTYNYFQ